MSVCMYISNWKKLLMNKVINIPISCVGKQYKQAVHKRYRNIFVNIVPFIIKRTLIKEHFYNIYSFNQSTPTFQPFCVTSAC